MRSGQWMRVLIATAIFTAAAYATLLLSRTGGGFASIWIANALVLGWALHRPQRELAGFLLAVVMGTALASVSTDRTLGMGFVYGLLNALEVGLAYAMLRALRLMPGVTLTDRGLLLLMGVVVTAPAASSLLSGLLASSSGAGDWTELSLAWWRSDAFGMFAVLPVLWSWSSVHARLLATRRGPEFLVLLLVSVALARFGVLHLSHPFVTLALPLLLAAVRLGVLGATIVNLAAMAGTLATFYLEGTGRVGGLSSGVALDVAQVWMYMCLSAIGPLLVSVVIGQRDAAMSQLASTSERLQLITDNVPAMIAYVGSDGRYRFVNENYRAFVGRSYAEIVGSRQDDVLDASLAGAVSPRVAAVLMGDAQQFELETDTRRWLDIHYTPQRAADGSVSGFFVLSQDVTWRRDVERRFQRLLESAPDGMVVMDFARRRIALVNSQMERIFGYARQQFVGRGIEEFIPDSALLSTNAVTAHLTGDGSVVDRALLLNGRRKDGSEFPVEVVLSRLQGPEDNQLVAAVRDITARRRVERALHEEKERAQVTLNSIGDAVVTCDTAMRIMTMNPIAASMTGWVEADAIGHPLEDVVQLRDPETGQAVLSPLAIAIESNRIVALQVNAVLRRRDGGESAVEDSAAPIRDREGNVIGGVMVFHDISESRAMALKMSHLAQHDYLTELPNRVLLQDRLAQALARLEQGERGAILFVDLDFFKHINDSLGHQAGDRVLQEVAARLVGVVRQDDTVSRQGGDEFVLLLTRLADPRDAARVAEKLIQAVERPIVLNDQALHVSASVGIALFPQDGRDISTLMKQADTALYHAKQAGRGRVSYFTAIMSEQADRRMRQEHDLRAAIAGGQLFLVYQPKVIVAEHRLSGVEALVRWRRLDGTVVTPDDFIPVAEETGLIVGLDEWVMREACRQNKQWQDEGLRRVSVAVNVSLARFDADRLVASVRSALQESGLAPAYLEIEFTESQMLGQHERAQHAIAALKSLGVKLAVDDFGTGYSSLSYLTRYKFDTLKIDRSFVSGLPVQTGQATVVQAIMGMADALDYHVVAEGVETREQAEALQRMGCLEMQGYLFSRPVDAGALSAMLRDGMPRLD